MTPSFPYFSSRSPAAPPDLPLGRPIALLHSFSYSASPQAPPAYSIEADPQLEPSSVPSEPFFQTSIRPFARQAHSLNTASYVIHPPDRQFHSSNRGLGDNQTFGDGEPDGRTREMSNGLPSPQPYPYPHHQSPIPANGVFQPQYPHPTGRSQPETRMPSSYPRQSIPSSSSISSISSATPPLTHPLPTVDLLINASSILDNLADYDKLNWAQDVLRVLDRHLYPSGSPSDLTAPEARPTGSNIPAGLDTLLNQAIPIIISFTTHRQASIAALASYLKGKLLASGSCSDFLPRDARQAFKDFEAAARGGEVRGWFRLGRDYETVGDLGRAKDCFDRGRNRGDCECTYRMGMAHLLGQLRLPSDPFVALPLLRQAYEAATIDFPQPSYVYGMLLAGELVTHIVIPPNLVLPPTSPPSDSLFAQHALARDAIERAAYLCLASAQFKCGFLYEHAALGCLYDPLMSVQWYSLASQLGEVEADMALSKWFLCGAEGHFPKNEALARTFAEKAARKGHPNGCFAMGYYYELGIGGRRDTDQARRWYQKAAKLQNADAINRLAALNAPNPAVMSLQEHESRVNDTLVHKRTQAKIRSDRATISRPQRKRNEQDRLQIEANRAAQAAARPIPGQPILSPIPGNLMSPAPRVGEIMSPGPFHPAMLPSSNSFPSRPPIPHHAFSSGASDASTGTSGSYPYPRRPSQPDQPRRSSEPKGPQTFAEMGFVSKPVQDEGCTIM